MGCSRSPNAMLSSKPGCSMTAEAVLGSAAQAGEGGQRDEHAGEVQACEHG